MFFVALLPLFALGAAAIKVTAPSNTTGWTTSGPQVIQWETVSTDPSNFTIQLINPSNPNAPTSLAQAVMSSDKTYTYTPGSALAVGGQWRVNFISSTNQAGILAQSDYFEVKQGDSVASSSSASSASASMTSGSTSSMASSAAGASGSPVASGSASAIPGATSSRAAAAQTLAQASGLGLLLITVLGYFA